LREPLQRVQWLYFFIFTLGGKKDLFLHTIGGKKDLFLQLEVKRKQRFRRKKLDPKKPYEAARGRLIFGFMLETLMILTDLSFVVE
jgi:hypothetical protein